MMDSPLIGISGSIDEAQTKQSLLRDYCQAILASNGIPMMLSLDMDDAHIQQALSHLDGLLLAGGNDIDPALFGQMPSSALGEVNPLRDAFELRLLWHALSLQMPVLGICRGIQVINVFFEGTLIQDIPSQHCTTLLHKQCIPYDQPSHAIYIDPTSTLGKLYPLGHGEVNSMHHQAVDQVAPCLRATAWSDDGLVEAIEHPNMPYLVAVQWHPERRYQHTSADHALFDSFTHACHTYACNKH